MQGKVVIGAELTTKDFDRDIAHLEEKLDGLIEEYEMIEKEKPFTGQAEELTKLSHEITTTKQKIEKMKQAKEEFNKTDFSSVKGSLNSVSNSIEGIIKKVSRWALAVFGVRSAYMFVRSAVSTLSQYNEQIATDIEYIRFALATMLQPIIEKLIQLVYTFLQYVNYLAQAWFGVNLFANASTKAFQNTNKALKESNKNAKELQKTIAGFDEMNVLQENGNVTSGGGGGGIAGIPSQELNKLNEIKIPKWMEKVKEFGEWVLSNWQASVIELLGIKVFFDLMSGNWIGVILDLIGLMATLYTQIQDIKKGIKDLNEIREQEQGMAKKSKESTESLIKTYHEVASTTGVTKEQTDQYVNTLLEGVKTNNDLIASMESQKHWYGELTGENEKITKTQQKYNETIQIQLDELGKLYDSGQLNSKQKAYYISLLDKQTTKLATENSNLNKNSEKFKENTEKIQKNKEQLEKITGKEYKIKTSIQNPDTSSFEWKIKNLLNKVGSWFSNVSVGFGFGGGMGFRAKGGIYYPNQLPRLASGGIINNPGRGVPYHGATIGERGAEAVLPLTDSQQMELLGEAIGRYVNLSANVPVYVGNRLVAREIRRIEANQSFAVNR